MKIFDRRQNEQLRNTIKFLYLDCYQASFNKQHGVKSLVQRKFHNELAVSDLVVAAAISLGSRDAENFLPEIKTEHKFASEFRYQILIGGSPVSQEVIDTLSAS